MKMKFLTFGIALSLVMMSCSKEKDETTITPEEATANNKIEIANNDVTDIVEEQESATYENSTSGRGLEVAVSVFAPCATITRNPAFGTAVPVGTLVTKTIDYGTTGCTLYNGNVVKGKVIITFVYDPNATTHTITYTFENFYHNNIRFNGNKSFTRVMSVATPNSPSHPIVTMNMDFVATFPDGNSYTRIGQRVREITSGYDTVDTWTDNVYQITGSWTTTFPSTTIQTSTITTPLIVKASCYLQNKPLIVQGIITFTRNSNSATLNYGDGTCDNSAIFIINGNSYTIVIGN